MFILSQTPVAAALKIGSYESACLLDAEVAEKETLAFEGGEYSCGVSSPVSRIGGSPQ